MLGVQSVPDGLATGLLAGVNPLAGLYGYMVGTLGGALATSSTFMAVQGTGAMAMLIADVSVVRDSSDPTRALVTLTMLTGFVMVLAGLLRLGTILRFVSNAVMVGFINAVGVNIVLGQLANLTGYAADGANRVIRAVNTVLQPGRLDGRTLLIGLATIALIVLLERTPLRSLGLVAAVLATSAAVSLLGWDQVATLSDLGVTLDGLPTPELPLARLVPSLLLPAAHSRSSASCKERASRPTSPTLTAATPTRPGDFLGQGIANLGSLGLFRAAACRSAARCRPRHSTRRLGPFSRWSSCSHRW